MHPINKYASTVILIFITLLYNLLTKGTEIYKSVIINLERLKQRPIKNQNQTDSIDLENYDKIGRDFLSTTCHNGYLTSMNN